MMKIYCATLNGLLAGVVAFGACWISALHYWL